MYVASSLCVAKSTAEQANYWPCTDHICTSSIKHNRTLAWPDPLCTGAYVLEIISGAYNV